MRDNLDEGTEERMCGDTHLDEIKGTQEKAVESHKSQKEDKSEEKIDVRINVNERSLKRSKRGSL